MHRIRLQGPWTKQVGHATEPIRTSVPDRLTAPSKLAHTETSKAPSQEPAQAPTSEPTHSASELVVCYQRRFNRPTGLERDSRVLLSIASWSGQAVEIAINGQALSLTGPPLETDIRPYLELHNCLQVRLAPSPAALPCLDGAVALIIDDASSAEPLSVD